MINYSSKVHFDSLSVLCTPSGPTEYYNQLSYNLTMYRRPIFKKYPNDISTFGNANTSRFIEFVGSKDLEIAKTPDAEFTLIFENRCSLFSSTVISVSNGFGKTCNSFSMSFASKLLVLGSISTKKNSPPEG